MDIGWFGLVFSGQEGLGGEWEFIGGKGVWVVLGM